MTDLVHRVLPPPPRPACVVLLSAGLVAGALLGPAFLGRVSPDLYDTLWRGGLAEQQALDDHLQATRDALDQLRAADVSGIAIEERQQQAAAESTTLTEQLNDVRGTRADRLHRIYLRVTLGVMAAAALTVLGIGRWTYPLLATGVGLWAFIALAAPHIL